MSINICEHFTYQAERNHYRKVFLPYYSIDFLVRALFRNNIANTSNALFNGKTVDIDDIAYYINDGKTDFMYIIKVDELKYLMNSSFVIVSDGYHQIVQLHDKIPQVHGYIAVKKSEKNMYCGILNNSGRELIECKYLYISPIICRTVLEHDEDYINEIADRREELLFLVCKNHSYGRDVYTYDGTLVFEHIDRINITEEKICYNYDSYEDTWCYTETKQLEKIHVGVNELYKEDDAEYWLPDTYRYVFRVNLYSKYAELEYIGIEEDDTRDTENSDKSRLPEIPLPKISRIEIDTSEYDFNPDKTDLCDFLRRITEDAAIYTYIEADEVNSSFASHFSSEISTFGLQETEKLKHANLKDTIDIVSEKIENILWEGSEERKTLVSKVKSKWLENENAEWLKEKIKHQSQITLDTKVSECYFGDKYDDSYIVDGEITIGKLRSAEGMSVLEFCHYNKKLFEEIVTVLLSHDICLADYQPGSDIQSYFEEIYENMLFISIEKLNFSPRINVILGRANILTLENLLQHTEKEIRALRNMGNRSFEEVMKKLEDLGVSLKQD